MKYVRWRTNTVCGCAHGCARALRHFSCVWLFVTLWIVAHQATLYMGVSRQEHWSELPCTPPGALPDPGIEPVSPSPVLQANSLLLSHQESPENKNLNSTKIGIFKYYLGLPCWLSSKESTCNAGSVRSIPGFGRAPGEGNGNLPLQFCLEIPPWAEEPGRPQSMGSQRVRHD